MCCIPGNFLEYFIQTGTPINPCRDLAKWSEMHKFQLTWGYGKWGLPVCCVCVCATHTCILVIISIYWLSYNCFCCSVTQSCLTVSNPMECSMPGPQFRDEKTKVTNVMAVATWLRFNRCQCRADWHCSLGYRTALWSKPVRCSASSPLSGT